MIWTPSGGQRAGLAWKNVVTGSMRPKKTAYSTSARRNVSCACDLGRKPR